MRAFFAAVLLAFAAACTPPAPPEQAAATAANDGVDVREPWAAPTPDGVTVSAGYLTIHNGGAEADRLLGAESARAGRVEVHEMIMEGAVMRMRAADAIVVDAGGDVVLQPGGQHLMFFDVTAPFVEGEEIPVRLRFERAGTIDVALPVRRPGAAQHGH